MLLSNEIWLPVFRSVDQCICLSKTEVVLYNRMSCPERKGKVRMEVSRAYPSVNHCEPKHSLIAAKAFQITAYQSNLQGPTQVWHWWLLAFYTLKSSDIITRTYFMGRINIQAWSLDFSCVVFLFWCGFVGLYVGILPGRAESCRERRYRKQV